MSRATAAVRFEDGSVRWCLYNGTSDVLAPKLYDELQQAWDGYYDPDIDNWATDDTTEKPKPVEICTDYGAGFHWHGTATHDRVIGPLLDNENEDYEIIRGIPDWFHVACQQAR